MPNTWILVADASKARLFEWPRKRAEPAELACYTYPDGRSPGRHSEHGRLPRVQESTNPSRHAIEPKTSLRDKHARRFADTLGTIVRQGRLEGRYNKLILVAPPRFLGALHDSLDEQTVACIVGEVRSELLALSPAELRTHLPD